MASLIGLTISKEHRYHEMIDRPKSVSFRDSLSLATRLPKSVYMPLLEKLSRPD